MAANYHQAELYAFVFLFFVFSNVFVGARIYAGLQKYRRGVVGQYRRLFLDDYFIIVSLVCSSQVLLLAHDKLQKHARQCLHLLEPHHSLNEYADILKIIGNTLVAFVAHGKQFDAPF